MSIGSTVGNIVGAGAAAVTDIGAQTVGALAFEAQIQQLAAVGLKATERSVTVRTVSTELASIKKVADERVQ
jgi:predicted DNA binding CopG/RHH family protein